MDPLASNRETGSRLVGRYLVHRRIAAGGMATVHLGRLLGAAGFSRTVAIKRLHDAYARDPEFVAMLLDEARLASQIRHPNVVPTLDVVAEQDELLVVMEYVTGDSLAHLGKLVHLKQERFPIALAATIVAQALHGLHAAHEARDQKGEPLDIVHRDVSPQNILVGTDGVARVLDFGIAKAASRATATEDGQVKGKTAYMAPEQLQHAPVDRRTDVFAAGAVLWELLTGKRLFLGDTPAATIARVLHEPIDPPTRYRDDCPLELAMVCLRALERDRESRFESAEEMALAIEDAVPQVPRAREVGAWVSEIAASTLESRAQLVREVESEDAPPQSHSTTDPALRAALQEAERRRNMSDLPTDMGRGAPPPAGGSGAVGVVPFNTPSVTGPIPNPSSSRRTVTDMPATSSRPVAAFPSTEVTDLATVRSSFAGPNAPGGGNGSRILVLLGVLGGILLAGLVATGVLVFRARAAPAKGDPPMPTFETPAPLPTPLAPASSTPPPPAPAPAPAPPPAPSTTGKKLPKPAPHPTPRGPDCRVPYTIDASGNKHIRPECVN